MIVRIHYHLPDKKYARNREDAIVLSIDIASSWQGSLQHPP